ncbi:MAG: PfkB family carbohydrate kinase [Kouleothrix sp.]
MILSRGADRAILTYPGSIAALRYDQIDLHMLDRARHLHLGAFYARRAAAGCRRYSRPPGRAATISLDTNYDPSERWDGGLAQAISLVDLFLPNEAELCAIAGSADVGLRWRLAGRVPLIGVKLGARGGVARQGHTIIVRAPALPVPVADTTGAGDSFDAGFVYGFVQGWGLEETLRLAWPAARSRPARPAAPAAQPTLAESTRGAMILCVTPNPAIDRTLELPQIVLGAVLRAKHAALQPAARA